MLTHFPNLFILVNILQCHDCINFILILQKLHITLISSVRLVLRDTLMYHVQQREFLIVCWTLSGRCRDLENFFLYSTGHVQQREFFFNILLDIVRQREFFFIFCFEYILLDRENFLYIFCWTCPAERNFYFACRPGSI